MIFETKMHLYLLGIFMYAYVKCTSGMTCDGPWQEYIRTCYLRYNSYVIWKHAMLTCLDRRENNQLVVIDNAKVNTFIHQNITNGSDVWLGLTYGNVSNVYDWTWSDGQSVTYIDDWNAASVTSFCVIMRLSDDEKTPYWHTQICTFTEGFVCEKGMVNHTCGNMWIEYETHCYLIISKIDHRMNNMAAARYCWGQGAYLVSINSRPEAKFLYKNMQAITEYWIGLSPLKWLDGTPLQWNNWDDYGPNKDANCVYMNHLTGQWSSGSCDTFRRFVCQECKKKKIISILNNTEIIYISISIVSTTEPKYISPEISQTSIARVQEPTTTAVSNTSKVTSCISSCQNISAYIAVIVVLVVIVIVLLIAVLVLAICFKRRLSAKEASQEDSVYYNEVTRHPNTEQETSGHRSNETDDKGNGSANDRSMYEQLSPESYEQSTKITTGDYACLK